MEKETEIIKTLYNIGASKEVVLEIMNELVFTSDKYAGKADAIDCMLKEKLGDDLYLKLINI